MTCKLDDRIQIRPDQRGMALAIVILSLLVLTTLTATMIFVTQTEIKTNSNYKLATQARYAAEAGAQSAANWMVYNYTPPSHFTSFDMTKYPVQYNGKPVVLSANSSVESNYPDSSIQQAFSAALLNQQLSGTGISATSAVSATLMSMQPAVVLLNSSPKAIQTWQITSQGSIPGMQNVQVQVVTQMQNSSGTSVYPNAGYSTSNACNSFTIAGNAKIDSFDSSLGVYLGTQQNSQGNLGSNGTIMVTGSGVKIYGNVVAAALTSLSCLLQALGGIVNNLVGQLTGTFTPIALPGTPATPPAPSPAPPTTSADIVNRCGTIAGCSSANGAFTLAPGSYGNVTVSGGKILHVSAGTYTVNSFTLTGGATIVVDSGPVVFNLAGNALGIGAAALDFSAGNVTNTTGVPADFQVVYAGSHPVKVSGALGASLVVYAPNAQLTLTGGGDLYGAFIALTIDDNGGSSIHYDRSLSNFVDSMGAYHTTSFTWSKF